MKERRTIQHRDYHSVLQGDMSTLDYNIVASGEIINEILTAIFAVEDKYPKEWDKKDD